MRWLVLLFLASPAIAQKTPDRLELAYKKEFAFLEAEKRGLADRLATVKRENKAAVRRAQGGLAVTQKTVLALGLQAETLAETLRTLDRDAEAAEEGKTNLEGLVQSVARGIEPYGATLPEASDAQKVAAGFAKIDTLIAERATVRTEKGRFFLADGKAVEGSLVRVGDVAIYGVSDGAAGALTPAGGGKFKLDPPQGEATARALAKGERPATLAMFLYESAEKNFEARKEKTPREIVESGGAIAWVIVGLGGVALLLIGLRLVLLGVAASAGGKRLMARLADLVAREETGEALATCQAARGGTARVLEGVVRGLDDGERETMENLVAERLVAEERRLDRFGAPILIIAAVAPLLGLLGTVTGMISTFDVITEFGTGNPKLLSGGISEALITTELGLIVAIPALLLGNLLTGWASGLKSRLEERALHLMNVARVGTLDVDVAPAPEPPAVDPPAEAVTA